jgi:CHAT domain-containing protein
MRKAHIAARLAAVVLLFSVALCAQGAARGSGHQNLNQGGRNRPQLVLSQRRSSHDPRGRAEEAFATAVALRDKQTAADLANSAKLFRTSAKLFAAAEEYQQQADADAEAGDIYFTLSQYDSARRSYSEALKISQDPEKRCRALSRIARTYAATGPLSQVERYANQASDLCQNLSPVAQAEALEARGEALDFAGDRPNSEDAFRRARDLYASAKDENGEARTLLMLAYSDLFSGDRQVQGLELAQRALQLWSSTGHSYGPARMRSVLGTFAISRGEFETAQCNYKIAKPVFHELGNKDEEASVLNGLGFVSRETGDWQKSLEYYRKARVMFATVHDMQGEHEAITGISKALTARNTYGELLALSVSELRLARKAGDPVLVAASLSDMAAAYEAESRPEEAENFYRRSLQTYREAHHPYGEGDVLIRLGRLQGKRSRYFQAIATLEQARAMREETGQMEELAKIQYELAYIYYRLNRLEDAQSAIEKTIETIEKQRVTISQFDSRAAYFASVHRYYALYIEILMSLDQRQPYLGFAEKAFDAAERSKVRSLLDLLTTSAQDAPCEELLQKQLSASDRALPGTLNIRPVATELEISDGKLKVASSPASTLTLPQVQAEIDSGDTVLLEYALGDEKSYLWIIDQDHISSHELPSSQQVKNLVEKFRRTLTPPQLKEGETATDYQARTRMLEQQSRAYARHLSRTLLGRVALAGKKRILIVPDGALQYIPFAALPRPDFTATRDPLVSSEEVVILPSASALASLRKTRRIPSTATAAIFADPVFESDDPRLSNADPLRKSSRQERPAALDRAISDIGGPSYIPRLLASRNEASAIAAILGSRETQKVRIALDFDANRDSVLSQGLSQYRFVHFATHGLVDTRHPERSGLILSLLNKRGRKTDGYLRLGDIYKLKLSADLVVLSSCDSALGQELESEGIIGLPRGFLYAGAKSVIATLYTRIERGESPSSALRGAQLEMIRDQQWSNPYYWAAFTLQGEYR